MTGRFRVGDLIDGKYEVVGVLGRGGHACVYDCVDIFLGTEVAVKVVDCYGERGPEAIRRTLREARLLFRHDHSHIVKVLGGSWLETNQVYFVMERLDGYDLRAMLRGLRRFTVFETLAIALQIADALAAAHEGKKGSRLEEQVPPIIHRDLKPENIFIEPPLHVKVLDFGISKALHQDFNTTQNDQVHGTAPYMSPEQAQGKAVTFASDVFQLGTIMYEMISGVCPCLIDVEDPRPEVLVAIQISKEPPRLKKLVTNIPGHIDNLVWKAIAKKPQNRYKTMREFFAAIYESYQRYEKELPQSELRMRWLPPSSREPHPALSAARGRKDLPRRAASQSPRTTPAPKRNAPAEPHPVLSTTPLTLVSSVSSEENTAKTNDEKALVEIATTQRAPSPGSDEHSMQPGVADSRDRYATLHGIAPPPRTAWDQANPDAASPVQDGYGAEPAASGHVDRADDGPDARHARESDPPRRSRASASGVSDPDSPAPLNPRRTTVRGSADDVARYSTWQHARKALHSSLGRAALIGLGVALPAGTYFGFSHRAQEQGAALATPPTSTVQQHPPRPPAELPRSARQEEVTADLAADAPRPPTELLPAVDPSPPAPAKPPPRETLEASAPAPTNPAPRTAAKPARKAVPAASARGPEFERVRKHGQLLMEELRPTTKTPAPAASSNKPPKRKLWFSND